MSDFLIDEIELLLRDLEELINNIFEKKFKQTRTLKEELDAKIENKLKKLKISKDFRYDFYAHKYNKIQWSFHIQMNEPDEAEFYHNQLKDYFDPTESFIYVSNTCEEDDNEAIEVVSSTDEIFFEAQLADPNQNQNPFADLCSYLHQQNVIRKELQDQLLVFDKYKSNLITNLADFIYMMKEFNLLCSEIENIIRLYISNDQTNTSKLLVLVLNQLDSLRDEHRMSFVIHVQNMSQPEKILFIGPCPDRKSIDKQFRLLSLYFHPDKVSSTDLVFRDFYILISKCRDNLLAKFSEDSLDADDIKVMLNKGNEYFREANKCRKIWIELENRSQDAFELKQSREMTVYLAALAYDYYKSACRTADRLNDLDKQFELRKHMLLCFFISDKIVEAQLVGVSLVFLIQKNRKTVTLKQRDQVSQLLEKINNLSLDKKETNIIFDKALVEYDDLNEVNSLISEQMKKGNFLVLSKIQNVRLNAPKTELMKASGKREWSLLKIAYDVGLVLSIFSIPGAILSNLSGTIMGIYVIIDKRKKLVEKLSSLEKMNLIIQDALNEYKSSDYLSFLRLLSQPYNSDIDKPLSLFKIDENKIEINCKHVVSILLELNFPPDGIAYLLNLIANALVSGIKFKQLASFRVQAIASDILDEISSVQLEQKAIKLDQDISSLRKLIGKVKINFSHIKNYLFPSKLVPEVADELLDESSTKGSFVKRLGEIKLAAKINTTILILCNAGLAGLDSAKVYIEQIQSLVNDQQSFEYHSETKMRLELLELLFWSLTGEANLFDSNKSISLCISSSADEIKSESSDQFISYLDGLIEKSCNKKEKIELLNKKGNKLMEKATTFIHYKQAYLAFMSSFKLDEQNNIAGIQIMKCFLNLNLFQKAILFSNLLLDNPFFEKNYQLWLYRGISYRHLNEFKSALHCLDESIKKQANEKAKNEITLVNSLRKDWYSLACYRQEMLNVRERELSSNKYRILCIDGGGGVSGILPIMLLAELERRTKRPISQMFDLICGSSLSGAPLAAGLCTGQEASYLFDFYVSKLNSVFNTRNYSFFSKQTYKMNSNAFEKIIQSECSLNNVHPDILITAVDVNNKVHVFSSEKSRRLNQKQDAKIKDIVLASCSKAEYFEPYKIENIGNFHDSSNNLMNNPAKLAYNECIQNGIESIFCLSLGVGCYVNDVSDYDKNEQVLNEYKVDRYLSERIGDEYKRLQFYMSEVIKLDDHAKIYDLLSIGKQFIQDNNESINQLVSRLLLF